MNKNIFILPTDKPNYCFAKEQGHGEIGCVFPSCHCGLPIKQEESKQIKCYCGHTDYCDCGELEEVKQETLEKVALKEYPVSQYENCAGQIEDMNENDRLRFKEGVEYAQKHMYSEEEVFAIILKMDLETGVGDNCGPTKRKKWFEQYKK